MLEQYGMFSRNHTKLFTYAKGPFGWAITEYKKEDNLDPNRENDNYIREGYSIHKDYESVFDRMMKLLNEGEDDPTPYCSGCGSMTMKGCACGPIADND